MRGMAGVGGERVMLIVNKMHYIQIEFSNLTTKKQILQFFKTVLKNSTSF